MNKQEREHLTRFTIQAIKAGFTAAQIDRMCEISRATQRLNEAACNYGLTDRQQKRADKLDNEMREICASVGLVVYCNGDPRGCPYKINEDEAGRRVNPDIPTLYVP